MDAPPVQYARTSDGYDIAYVVMGEGRPFVCVSFPFSHIQGYWSAPGDTGPWLKEAAERFKLVYYDARGVGLSTRNLDAGLTIDSFVTDIETVTAKAALTRFVLYGLGFVFGHAAIHYAAKHPERVQALVLMTSALRGDAWPTGIFEILATQNWDSFLWTIAPKGASLEETESNVRRLRQSTFQDDWLASYHAFLTADVEKQLARLSMPVLVMHARDYVTNPAEESMKLAARIPGARLVMLDGSTRLGNVKQSLDTIERFLDGLPASTGATPGLALDGLSPREAEVLRLLAAGRSNQQIADDLVISLNTARKHVASILDKTGTANRTEAAGYARDNGLV